MTLHSQWQIHVVRDRRGLPTYLGYGQPDSESVQKRGELSQDKKSEALFSLLYWLPIKPAPPSAPKHQMRQPLNREMIGPIKAVWARPLVGGTFFS